VHSTPVQRKLGLAVDEPERPEDVLGDAIGETVAQRSIVAGLG
jgi:hypothetical protein